MRFAALFAILSFLAASPCAAGDTLELVKSRGEIRCGVPADAPGFAIKDKAGRWSGFNVDLCRAVAAAVLGSSGKATFVPLTTSARFDALASGDIDLLAHNTTWSLNRVASLNVDFAGPVLFTGQAFLVRAKDALEGVMSLDGAKVGVARGSTHVHNLEAMAVSHGLRFQTVLFDSAEQARDALFAGKCQAVTDDDVLLAAFRSQAPGGPGEFAVLPDRFSLEPLALAVKRGDEKWRLAVRGVLAALIAAEECGLTREIAVNGLDPASNKAGALFLRNADALAKPMGVESGWALRAIKEAGNYGELYERNLGGPLGLPRGLNRLWSKGGLLYAPPF